MKSKFNIFSNGVKAGLTVLISVLIIFTIVQASTIKITPPTGTPVATFYSLSEIYNFITANTAATVGSPALDWSASLEDTGRTLTEIYSALASLIVADKVFTGTTYLGTTGTLTLACATSTFDGTANKIADAYDGSGNGANRWCMATSTNSASASDIVRYKSAWVNGAEVNGSFASTTETATTTGVTFSPPAGSWFSSITVAITNLIAGVIKSGETAGGVAGSLLPSGGTATAANVATGITFFGASQTNWTLQTGTFDPWTPQRLQTKDDWVNSGGTSGEYILEEATWSAVSGSPFSGYDSINYVDTWGTLDLYSGAVKQDTRTGLWWSDVIAVNGGGTASSTDNQFTLSADGSRPTGGNAIGFCAALNSYNSGAGFGGHNDWYLPTQKQSMQAYIDGSANNLPNPDYFFWSSSELSWDPTDAWFVTLNCGYTGYSTKTTKYYVRCVRP